MQALIINLDKEKVLKKYVNISDLQTDLTEFSSKILSAHGYEIGCSNVFISEKKGDIKKALLESIEELRALPDIEDYYAYLDYKKCYDFLDCISSFELIKFRKGKYIKVLNPREKKEQ